MKVTNKEMLPDAVVHAVTHDRYDAGDRESISCTTLIGPAQQRYLRLQHENEVEEDATLRIWAMIGSAVHYVLENAIIDMKEQGLYQDDTISEKRFYWDVDGRTISAQIDLYEYGDLNDFKITSVWAMKDAIFNGKFEWDAQLNIQSYLMEKNGYKVGKLFIVAIGRDWNKSGSLRDKDYPPRACKIEVPKWSMEKTESYIKSRLNAHFSKHVPLCTPDEMWETPTKYALMKKGRKTALRLLPSTEEIMDYAAQHNHLDEYGDLESACYIEERPGERKRCMDYCEVNEFCEQYQSWRLNVLEKETDPQ